MIHRLHHMHRLVLGFYLHHYSFITVATEGAHQIGHLYHMVHLLL